MLAFVECINRDTIMPMVGGRDNYRIDVTTVQNFAVVLCCKNSFAIEFLRTIKSTGVKIAYSDKPVHLDQNALYSVSKGVAKTLTDPLKFRNMLFQ
jgi:hypothetical protein